LAGRAKTSLPQLSSIGFDIGKRRPTERIANKGKKPAGFGRVGAPGMGADLERKPEFDHAYVICPIGGRLDSQSGGGRGVDDAPSVYTLCPVIVRWTEFRSPAPRRRILGWGRPESGI
jgi:hypothetical protein